jgi:hypothetical protein
VLRKYFLIMLLTLTALTNAHPVYAQAVSTVYVDKSYTGTEDGTQSRPYNTLVEGIALARALSNGGLVYLKQADGSWKLYGYIAPGISGPTGGEGGPTFSDSTVTSPLSETPTSLSSGETATAVPPATAPSLPYEVTATPPSPEHPPAVPSGILYAIIAVLTLGLIFVIVYYQQRLRRH